MARQEVSRTTHIEEGELRVTHENAILTNITVCSLVIFELSQFFKVVGYYLVKHIKIKFYIFTTHSIKQNKHKK